MPVVPREEEGEGLVPIGARRHPGDCVHSLVGIRGGHWTQVCWHIHFGPGVAWGRLRLAWWYTQA